jgi:hypothetical protein
MWGGFGEAKQNEQTCRLAGLCGNGVKTPVSSMSAPSYAEVQKNPRLAMQAVLKQCSGGYVLLSFGKEQAFRTDARVIAEAFPTVSASWFNSLIESEVGWSSVDRCKEHFQSEN